MVHVNSRYGKSEMASRIFFVPQERYVSTLEDANAQIQSLWLNNYQLEHRVRELEKMIDTKNTIWWKRILFRVDGWSPWYRVDKDGPKWRPWRRWWRS